MRFTSLPCIRELDRHVQHMSGRHRNLLPDNLPQLQNLIKRDPASYEEEFLQQYRHYEAQLQIFHLKPSENYKPLCEVVIFLCQVTQCYPQHLTNFPQELIDLVRRHGRVLDPELRMTLCRGLIMIRNKGLLPPIRLLELFFELFRCQDKLLRKTLYLHIVSDIKNINARHKNNQLNTQLQNFMYTMLRDSNHVAAKMSLDALVDLYKKNVWRDAKTVNVIATACLSPLTKVMVGAIKFFLGTDEEEEESSDSDDEDKPTARELVFRDKVNKKTRKRKRKLERAMTVVKKHKKKKNHDVSNFSALHLLHDPQDFAEKLFKQLEKSKDRFEVKVMLLNLISRLIGVHKLFVFNFYPFVQRFLQPHQRDVTKLLMYTAQACHDLVPPEVAEPALMAVVNNFISERNSSEVMAVGLNAVREMCARCPLIMKEDLLRDLAQYKSHRSKNVVMAARSLIQLYRGIHPDLLHKKDRGRPTVAALGRKPLQYGELEVKSFVPGTELLTVEDLRDPTKSEVIVSEEDSGESDDDEWHDVNDSGDEIVIEDEDTGGRQGTHEEEELKTDGEMNNSGDEIQIEDGDGTNEEKDTDFKESTDDDDDDDDDDDEEEEEEEVKTDDQDCEERENEEAEGDTDNGPTNTISVEKVEDTRMTSAEMISQMKLLTPADFKKIRKRQLEQEIEPKLAKKRRKTVKIDLNREDARGELVSLGSIETVHKSAKLDKQARLASIMAGREDRPKFKGGRKNRRDFASTSHKEKQKSKNFLMMRTTRKLKQKSRRSFREKQIALKNSLLKNKRSSKMKR